MEQATFTIGALVHDMDMLEQYDRLSKLFHCKLIARYITSKNCISEAINMEQLEGASALIAHSRHVDMLRPHVRIPLIVLPNSEFTYAYALIRAKRHGRRIAFIDHSSGESLFERRDYIEIAKLLSCPLPKRYICSNNNQLNEILDKIEADRYDVVIGGSTEFRKAMEGRSIPYEFLYIRDAAIIEAVTNAIASASLQENLNREIGWMNSFLAAFPDGIISLKKGAGGQWYLTALNDRAVRSTMVDRQSIIDCPVPDAVRRYPVLEPILAISPDSPREVTIHQKQHIVICREIVGNSGETLGKLYQLQTADEIKRNELYLRQSVLRSGFTAKTTFSDIIGKSAAIQTAITNGIRFAGVTSNIMITGESGSGKEMFAQSIHNASSYSEGPFLALNCATLPESLLEAELFGYEPGTFTGANKKGKQGVLELAHRGTLFLDEVAEMPLTLQAMPAASRVKERSVFLHRRGLSSVFQETFATM